METKKREYDIIQTTERKNHQTIIIIQKKITWKSEIGEREEWIDLKTFKFGEKTGKKIKELIRNIQETERGEELTNQGEEEKYTDEEEE